MLVFLPHAPGDIDAAEIVYRENAHRHSEVIERLVHLRGRGAFLHQELRLAHVWEKHAIADEAAAVPHHDADLSQSLCDRQRGGDHSLARFGATYDLQQPHHICGTEKVRASDHLRTRRDGGNLIDVERGG